MSKVLAIFVVFTWIVGLIVGAVSTDFMTAKIGWLILCFPAGAAAGVTVFMAFSKGHTR